jgi:HK97 family phage major capsid protein
MSTPDDAFDRPDDAGDSTPPSPPTFKENRMDRIIAEALASLAALELERSNRSQEQRTLAEGLAPNASFTEAQQARFEELTTEKRTLTAQIDAAQARVEQLRADKADDDRLTRGAQEQHPAAPAPAGGTARTQNRETIYTQRTALQEGVSFFTDAYRAQMGMAAPEVTARLTAHMVECRENGQISQRAIGTGNLGGLVPPLYLVEEAAAIARAGRPTANIVRRLPLPATGQSLVIPRGTTGVTAAIQATQNSAVSNTDAAITDLTVPVVTIAGQQDVSRQALERGEGVDSLIFGDLAGAYAVALDSQVLSGTGSGGQMLGIIPTAGITQMSAFVAAATIATFYSKLAGAINAVQTGRFFAPNAIVLHPRRWAWLTSQLDSSGRPLVVPNQNGPMNAVSSFDVPIPIPSSDSVGTIQGVPVYTDASIPTAVGTGPEDQVLVIRREDQILWEDGDGSPQQLRFEQTTGGSLTVKLVAYGYAAFTAGRFPLATALIGGNAGAGFGLVAPTF